MLDLKNACIDDEKVEFIQRIEDKKIELKRYKNCKLLVERLTDKLSLLEDKTTSVRAIKFSDEPRGGCGITNNDLILEKLELEERIKKMSVKCTQLRKEVIEEIDKLEDVRYVEVLEGLFVDCKTPEQISKDNGYSVRHVFKIYADAVAVLAGC